MPGGRCGWGEKADASGRWLASPPGRRLGGRASAVVWQRVRRVGPSGTTLYTYDESGHLLGEYDGSGALVQGEPVHAGECT